MCKNHDGCDCTGVQLKKNIYIIDIVTVVPYKVVPQFGIAKLVNITPIKPMVYGRYNELVNGDYKPTNITGGHHPARLPILWWTWWLTKWFRDTICSKKLLSGESYPRNRYPLVIKQKAIENGHRKWMNPHWKWWFSIVMLVYQRICL